MLRLVFTDTDGVEHTPARPLSVTVRMDEKVPADDLIARFAYTAVGELAGVRVYDDSDLIFVGIVDEQSHIFTKDGMLLQVSARSLAAHLLDNEAMPCCYSHPSASLIYERYVMPYGITWEAEDDATYFGEQQINKGMSLWTVLKGFCNACYSSVPRVTADGRLKMKAAVTDETITFSAYGGIPYTELREERRRCEEISRINVKISDEDGYRCRIDNADAIRRGVRRERYLNAALAATPMTCADTMLRNAEDASYGVQLKCAGQLTRLMGSGAEVDDPMLGNLKDLYISGVTYRMDKNGEVTTLRLKRRRSDVDI